MPLLSLITLFFRLELHGVRTASLPTPKLELPSPAVPPSLGAARATGSTDPLGTWGGQCGMPGDLLAISSGLESSCKEVVSSFCPALSQGTWGCSRC